MDTNWFLYVCTADNPKEEIEAGESGVGRTSISPGIQDSPYGVFYVAPHNVVMDCLAGRTTTPENVKEAILYYYR